MTDHYVPPRYLDWMRPGMGTVSAPEHDPSEPSTIFIMFVDQLPPLAPAWKASDQGRGQVLAEFSDPDRDAVIAWAKARPNVKRIYVEQDGDVRPLD